MSHRSKHLIAALCLAAAVVAFRLLPIYGNEALKSALANLAPLAALALCGGMLLPRQLAAGVTFGAFLVSDVALNLHYGQPVLNVYSAVLLLAFAAIFFGGRLLRRRPSFGATLAGTLGGVALFYVVTNTAAFFYDPGYAKTFGGWAQALSVGLPGFAPTWVFGLRALASNLVFALAFYLAVRPQKASTQPAAVPAAA
jgi:hypothetical protein